MPTKLPIAFVDILAAHQLKEGILLALLDKEKNNTGKVVIEYKSLDQFDLISKKLRK